MPTEQPINFGKYILLERINVGGMAEVYKAKAKGVEGFEKLIAIKRILPNLSDDKEFIQMFVDEAKIAGQLSHANIGQIYDLGYVGKSYFIAMEYINGKDVRAIYNKAKKRNEQIAIPIALLIIQKVADGLMYAHNKPDSMGFPMNIVHRDISPQNILVSYDGEVKIIDFGIAKAATKVTKTQAGILKGKFGYMSPEQVRGLPLDGRSDIFSLGIILYECLTGQRLFGGDNEFNTIEKIRNAKISKPSIYNDKIPPELDRIVMKVLAKDIDDRYRDAREFSEDIQKFMVLNQFFANSNDLSKYIQELFSREMAKENSRMQELSDFDPESERTQDDSSQPVPPKIRKKRPSPLPSNSIAKDEASITQPPKARRQAPRKKAKAGGLGSALDDYLSFLPKGYRKATAVGVSLLFMILVSLTVKRFHSIEADTSSKVEFYVYPPNAEIAINGVVVSRESPHVESLEAGDYDVEISAVGFRRHSEKLLAEKGQRKILNVQLVEDKLILVKYQSNPPGAEVFISTNETDNNSYQRIGTTPHEKRHLNGRKIRVKMIKSGFLPYDEEIVVSEQKRYVNKTLKPIDASLSISTTPRKARVFVDGKLSCYTPCTIPDLDPDKKVELVIRKSGYRTISRNINFIENYDQKLNIKLRPR